MVTTKTKRESTRRWDRKTAPGLYGVMDVIRTDDD